VVRGDEDALAAVLRAIGGLSLTNIVRVQERLSRELKLRFEKPLALVFSDIVGSTAYFRRFGDEAGRKLQQRHFDLVHQVTLPAGGRIVDTAGDGAFLVFPSADAAAAALIELQKGISLDNAGRSRADQLEARLGFHFGSVITDGQSVSGEAVNLAARVADSCAPGEIRLTREAFRELRTLTFRLSSRSLGPVTLKEIATPVEILTLDWRDRERFPASVRIRETGDELRLPSKDTITFGRLGEDEGLEANDIVLALPDELATRKISRWHFELRRQVDGLSLRQLSDRVTEVDGRAVAKGDEVRIGPGSVVRVGRAITIEFFSRALPETLETRDASASPE
jgi:class 3 adenylate cyclase